MLEHLDALIVEENSLSKVETVDQLHHQRGYVAGLQRIKFLLHNPPLK